MNRLLINCYKKAYFTMLLNEDTELVTNNGFKMSIIFKNKMLAISPLLVFGDGSRQPGGQIFLIFSLIY